MAGIRQQERLQGQKSIRHEKQQHFKHGGNKKTKKGHKKEKIREAKGEPVIQDKKKKF
jgi:hypothetical protein